MHGGILKRNPGKSRPVWNEYDGSSERTQWKSGKYQDKTWREKREISGRIKNFLKKLQHRKLRKNPVGIKESPNPEEIMGRSKDFQRSRQNKRRKTGESKIKSKEISPKPGGKPRRLGGNIHEMRRKHVKFREEIKRNFGYDTSKMWESFEKNLFKSRGKSREILGN
jgi:hypothetical protein